ncbi:MAG: DMT family transporter [Bacteroidales bacterium]|nr:DMT family transporter [Bacteroidales bacterium]
MVNRKLTGTLCGIGAAVCYGTNPLGALKLYEQGMTTNNVLFFRFSLAWLIVAAIVFLRRESVAVTWRQFRVLTALGLLFIVSSLTLYLSFHHMAAGVASTILFTYPVMTAVIMALLFKEKVHLNTIVSIVLSLVGVLLLYWGDGNGVLSTVGVLLVLASALSYAVYIIVMEKGELEMSSFKINFYVLAYCALGMLVYSILSGLPMQVPHGATSWLYVLWLALVPGILALVMMVYAAKYIGSTATAIIGALEPLTAVLIGVAVFAEPMSLRLLVGIVLILGSVGIITLARR